MKIITLANQKGGCGKSTIAYNLAVTLANLGYKTVFFDADPQQSCKEAFQRRLDQIVTAVSIQSNIHRELENYRGTYDIAVIDTPPHDGDIMALAVVCSDLVLIPVQDSALDISSTKVTVDLVLEAQDVNPELKAFFVLSRIQPNTILARELAELLGKSYDLEILNAATANRVDYKYAMIYGQSVVEFKKTGSAAQEIEDLTNEVIEILTQN